MTRRIVIWAIVVAAIIATIVGLPTLITMLKTAEAPVQSREQGPANALEGMTLAGIKTIVVEPAAIQPALHLTGQVVATETGQASITVPVTGVLVQPLIRVGDTVQQGSNVAVINTAFGQTAQQALQKLEQDQAAVVQAESGMSQAESALGQAQSTLSQARTTYSQALDTDHQAQSELRNAHTDLLRKKRLLAAGVSSQSDVEDATERYEKAVSGARDSTQVVNFARQGVAVATQNLKPAQDTLRLASDQVKLARATLLRDQTLYSQASVTGATLPQNLTPVHLGARLNSRDVAATTEFYIRSPIAGVVTGVTMSAGQAVSPGTALATVVDTREVYVDANAFESDLTSIGTGNPVQVTSAAAPDRTFTGHVRTIARQVDPTSRTLAVRSLIANPSGLLRPAMFVSVSVMPRQRRTGLVVPENAVLIHGNQKYVYVRTGPQKFEKRPVVLGPASGGNVEIRSGLSPGAQVVTEGNLLLDAQE